MDQNIHFLFTRVYLYDLTYAHRIYGKTYLKMSFIVRLFLYACPIVFIFIAELLLYGIVKIV